ncbi:hypothetical protein [Halomonas sp. OfavH-34-E]|uniref:hypothetical protein n=1 Tax=Halomonas sp. OfavH-34-E TaxID=2954491 RepID=UPI002096CC02|nr:hypothetical protein [Halomonas sp. OfavH-34-E]MCO7216868.1 hypothetical protein [Halomonas sp. OfavH-34-E]
MFDPVKEGLGEFLQDFYDQVVPTTKSLQEFVERGFPYCAAWAPARMVDKAEEMLASYQRNDTHQGPTRPPSLPVILVAVSKDWTPTERSFTTQIADPVDITFPEDPKQRYFRVRTVAGEVRAQLAFFASDEPTAKSLAAQFLLYLDSASRRRFLARYPFAGLEHEYPAQVEAPDNPAMNVETGNKNLTVLAVDLVLKVTVPLFMAPKAGEPNDGKGVPGTDDPAGYPLVSEVDPEEKEVSS